MSSLDYLEFILNLICKRVLVISMFVGYEGQNGPNYAMCFFFLLCPCEADIGFKSVDHSTSAESFCFSLKF